MTLFRALFDTNFDTNKYFVAMRTSIQPHNYVNREGKSQLFLIATQNSKRKRLPLGIYVNRKQWNKKTQNLKEISVFDRDVIPFLI